MRDFLDAILAFIGAASLSDDEFASIDTEGFSVGVYTIDVYNAILSIVDDRELVSTTRDRLRYLFLAKGVEVEESSRAKSNIFLGGEL